MSGRGRSVASAVLLWAAAAAACGGCAQLLGVDWSSYTQDAGAGGTGGTGGGTGTGSTAGTGGGAGAPECSTDEEKCAGNTPQRCVDGRWENGEPCVEQTCLGGLCIGECGPEDVRCADNRPQRCDARGQWSNQAPCPLEAPVCSGKACVPPPSCAGLEANCGPAGDESCCATMDVTGGTFDRDNNSSYPAIVSNFRLDRFEVTVGRFRKFVEAYPGSKPAPGAGAHPKIAGSGWDPVWDHSRLPMTETELRTLMTCEGYATWTAGEDKNELLPVNCVSWYTAFAFCAWDGGRLPTEAEWNYAAAGGDEQRVYPWSKPASDEAIDADHAVYDCVEDGSAPGECALEDIPAVGSRSSDGDGRWMQADLAGSMWEWALDWYSADYPAGSCDDCANLAPAQSRVARGGSWLDDESYLRSSLHHQASPSARFHHVGIRCARSR